MNRLVALLLPLGVSLVVVASNLAAETRSRQTGVVEDIENLGGKATVDEKSPDKPIVAVDFGHLFVNDARLQRLSELTTLQSLDLRNTLVTDAGLEHLKGLTNLQRLTLPSTVTGPGLEYLKRCPNFITWTSRIPRWMMRDWNISKGWRNSSF